MTTTEQHVGQTIATYSVSGAGAIVGVPEKDAEILLAKTRKVGGCCGSKPHVVHFFIRR